MKKSKKTKKKEISYELKKKIYLSCLKLKAKSLIMEKKPNVTPRRVTRLQAEFASIPKKRRKRELKPMPDRILRNRVVLQGIPPKRNPPPISFKKMKIKQELKRDDEEELQLVKQNVNIESNTTDDVEKIESPKKKLKQNFKLESETNGDIEKGETSQIKLKENYKIASNTKSDIEKVQTARKKLNANFQISNKSGVETVKSPKRKLKENFKIVSNTHRIVKNSEMQKKKLQENSMIESNKNGHTQKVEMAKKKLKENKIHSIINVDEDKKIETQNKKSKEHFKIRLNTNDNIKEPREERIKVVVVDEPEEDTRERKYCEFCNVGYLNEFCLQKHALKCTLNPINSKKNPETIFYCRVCHFGITDKEFFKDHESKCHNQEDKDFRHVKAPPTFKKDCLKIKKFKCNSCDYVSDRKGHMTVHERTHSKIPLFICDICHKGFSRMDCLRRHMFRHLDLAEEIKVLESIQIWNDCATKATIQVLMNNKNIKIIKYACNKCEYASPIADSVEKHLNCVHLKETIFKCHICPFTSTLKPNLRQHLNWHTKERTFKCSYCPYETPNKTYIKKHEYIVHSRTIVYECDFCDYQSYKKNDLQCHINSEHSIRKRYECNICDYSSYYPAKVISHTKKIHFGRSK